MGELFLFAFPAFFSGALGVILGGPFRVLVVENEAIESPIARAIFGFIFFPPVVGVLLLLMLWITGHPVEMGPFEWGAVCGLLGGMSYSYRLVGKSDDSTDGGPGA